MDNANTGVLGEFARVTNVERDRRVGTVLDLLLRGTNRRTIRQFAASTWKVSGRQADRYIQAATEMAVEEQSEEREKSFSMAVARIKKMLMKNADGDQKTVLEICKELHKLQGVYPAEKQEVKMSGSLASTLSDEELERAIAAASGKGESDGGSES